MNVLMTDIDIILWKRRVREGRIVRPGSGPYVSITAYPEPPTPEQLAQSAAEFHSIVADRQSVERR